MKTSKDIYQELVQEPFWNSNVNPITGYYVDAMANFNEREQDIINRRAIREAKDI